MNDFAPRRRLEVWRRWSTGFRTRVGVLAQNRQGVFFQYDHAYLSRHPSLSPFTLPFDAGLHQAPATPHEGLHGVFADSLPDGWARMLMDRVFRQRGIVPNQLTTMDRLAYVGQRGLGALEYVPGSEYPMAVEARLDIWEAGEQARAVFDAEREDVPSNLTFGVSSGGARPKIEMYLPTGGDLSQAGLHPAPGHEAWLVKFTSASLPLGHEEGLCEAAYLTMAKEAGIETPEWRLLPVPPSQTRRTSPATAWLALKRFDCSPGGGRFHLHSLAGLLDADFRAPTMDYEDLIKASQALCASAAVGQTQFARAVFNLLAANQDDHTRNWAFLQDDDGNWQPTAFYDVTFSPNPHGEHTTAFLGHGADPPLDAVRRLADQANFAGWRQAREVVDRVTDAIGHWERIAAELGVRRETRRLIERRLSEVRARNKGLLARSVARNIGPVNVP
ncbi:MAG: type II toxin-antitoxin system HipA family toxin [Gammaproteobacteria bacterium]|nr:type II toxin-antitoxin system HipA family toxin [Gammaproteobacteria bacterium]